MIDLTKIDIENELWPEDAKLFEQMEGNYQSENEKTFFESIHVKMLSEYAPCGDCLLYSTTNEDEIYIDRVEYSEFVVGSGKSDKQFNLHTMSLAEALNADLKKIGILNYNVTLWQWLRKRDYGGIMYDQNQL